MSDVVAALRAEIESWPGVQVEPHRFGGAPEFSLGKRELGHLHGDRVADLPFTRSRRDELIAAGQVTPHHLERLSDSGWGSYWIHGPEDVPALIELFRGQYERAVQAAEKRAARGSPAS